jgi:ergothioneine biosynthesis protein EgtB
MSSAAPLMARFAAVRAATESLAAPLSAEDQLLQSMPNCSPTKWHRAHTAWFFEEFVLKPRGHAPHRAEFGFLFNSYYEAVGPRHPRPARGMLSRPSCEEVAAYRRAVDAKMLDLLGGLDAAATEAIRPLVELGLAHEEQHQELLLTDILHALSQSSLLPAYRGAAEPEPEPRTGAPAPLRFEEFEGGLVTIGRDARDGFAFDSETPAHRVWLEPFALASRPISNAEVRAFVEAGGYGEPSLWLSEGYDFVKAHDLQGPMHARLEGGRFRGFTLDGEVTLDDDAPAGHLSYYEADALARFLGGRLPTEAEWETAAQGAAPEEGHFRESGALRPRAASLGDPSRSGRGVGQLFGDVWEWTSSAYAPYPGYAPAHGAVGEYNGKFMVSQLVLRGGSYFTPRGHVRSYRNFWHPDTRFQMTGARVAQSRPGSPSAVRAREVASGQ